MAICREFYFPSSDGSSRIHAAEWMPESGEIIGVLQIAHGVAEYGMRYAPFAEFMTEHGFAVVANDHLGHGLSAEKDADTLYFGPRDGWKHVVDDHVRHALPHEGKISRCSLFSHGPLDGLVPDAHLSHPLSRHRRRRHHHGHGAPVPRDRHGRARHRQGRGQAPRLQGALSARGGAGFRCLQQGVRAQPRTEVDWLSASDNNVDAYIADPLCGQKASIGLFYEMLGGIRFISTPKNIASMNRNTPILFISGDKDPVGEMGKGVKRAYEAFRRAGVRNVELKLYKGLRHEILNEDCRAVVYNDLWSWIEKHL